LSEGKAEAGKIAAEAEAEVQRVLADSQNQCAAQKADLLDIEGKTEGEMTKMLAAKRAYEVGMRKLNVLNSMSYNKEVAIYGNQHDNVLSQMAAFRLVQEMAPMK
jgi:hypothetical protein